MPTPTPQAALLKASTPVPQTLFQDLITANHILHHRQVLDHYGHISVRNPQNPATFFVSKSLAPALVSSRQDIEEYYVEDAEPVNKNAQKGYVERFIHSEIYKKYSDVNSVVHSHSEAVIPFSVTSIPLQPVFHMAGFLAPQSPVYDISLHYKSSDTRHSLLVTAPHLGAALAAGMQAGSLVARTTSMLKSFVTSTSPQAVTYPSSPVILMRGHGFTSVGVGIREAVFTAVFTCANARIQTTASLMLGSFNLGFVGERFGAGEGDRGPAKREEVKYLSDREGKDAWTTMQGTIERPWGGWCREVEECGLYSNEYLEGEDEVRDEVRNEVEGNDEEEHER